MPQRIPSKISWVAADTTMTTKEVKARNAESDPSSDPVALVEMAGSPIVLIEGIFLGGNSEVL